MKKHNSDNERIKRKYFTFMKEAKRQNEASIDAIAKALKRFEDYNKFRDFKAFHFAQAVAFKKHLANQENQQTGKKLSKATMNSTLRHLKAFFQWLSMQTGYKSRINYSDAEYFNLSEKDARVATAPRMKPVPTIEQIKHVIGAMSSDTVLERRNRCLIAFTLLTGARDSAIASMKLKHIDLEAGSVFQDAREVKTKNSKTFITYFFPVGDEIHQIVRDWVLYLKNDLLWGNDDPLFPKTEVTQGENHTFQASGIKKEHWSTASPIRAIFKDAFESAGIQYFNPHSFRNTLVELDEKVCQSPEAFKAWSQNMGHSGVLTTFFSYGEVQPKRQGEIIQQLGVPREVANQSIDTEAIAKAVAREMKNGM
ncbi:MAG: tyrosine-type recombinase/integrase [Thiotrichaceae bacterium]|nr:tyrosine-type recombinase/integrase [Thiotrichaceae bacterium]PCI13085.1 MAG: recombinase XerC [Thiotrichales bacterium]